MGCLVAMGRPPHLVAAAVDDVRGMSAGEEIRRARLGACAAAVSLFGMANVPFVYVSVNVWRTVHPKTTVVPSLGEGMRGPFWFCVATFLLLFLVLLAVRVRLAEQQAELERLYLELGDRPVPL